MPALLKLTKSSQRSQPTPPRAFWRRALSCWPLALLALLGSAVLGSGLLRHLSLDELHHRRALLQSFVHDRPLESLGAYLAAYVAVVGLSLPGALIMTLTAGFMFGAWYGAAAAVMGCSMGAVLMFLVIRSIPPRILRRWVRPGGLVERLEAEVRPRALSYLITLRMLPGMPFAVVNVVAAFVNMPLRTYVLGTVLGVIPSTLIYSWVGAGLGALFDHGDQPGLAMLLRPQVLWPLSAVTFLALAPHAYRLWRSNP